MALKLSIYCLVKNYKIKNIVHIKLEVFRQICYILEYVRIFYDYHKMRAIEFKLQFYIFLIY